MANIAQEISSFLTQEFDLQRYRDFISCIFSNQGEFEFQNERFEELEGKGYHKLKREHCLLPNAIEMGDFQTLQIYVFEVESINAKIGLYNELRDKLRSIASSAILACFYQKDNPSFRLSLITRSLDKEGKIDYSNPKRQSFTLGKSETTNTAEQNFQELATNWKISPTLETLTQAFSVEPVTKAFFEGYKKLYDKKFVFLSNIQVMTHIFLKAYPQEDPKKSISTFVKKLLGRIVFLYFIQKKGWLGVPKDKDWGEGDKHFLKTLFDNHNDDFYAKALAPLFFESLNKDRRNDKDYSSAFDCRIPFLNGGLFEEGAIDRDEILCELLDKRFFEDIFELFERYNFTIDESTPSEIEVGIDPEMLGKVFENLIDYNKETGAFYTRRGIVHFMCKNSLVLKLTQVFGEESKEHIENLIYNQESDNDFARKNANKILEILKSLKILDPAIGSGAYPMGLLSEILSIHTTLNKTLDDSKIAEYKREIIENNIYGIDIDFDAIEIAKLRFWLSIAVDEQTPRPLPNLDFKFMQGNSLLETLDGIDLLPKDLLLTRITPIDSLFSKQELGMQEDLLDYGNRQNSAFMSIKESIHTFFKTTDPNKKQNIKEKIRNEIDKILKEQIKTAEKQLNSTQKDIAEIKAHGGEEGKKIKEKEKQHSKLSNQLENAYKFQESFINKGFRTDLLFLYKLFFGEVFQDGGFDIVIGNPPYLRQERIPLKNQIKSEFGNFFNGNADIYTYFFAKGIQVLKPNGILSFVTSNKWARAGYGKQLRELILSCKFSSYIDFNGVKAFDNAIVDTSITTLFKASYSSDWALPVFVLSDEDKPSKVLDDEKMIAFHLGKNSTQTPQTSLSKESFSFADSQTLALKRKIEEIGTPLKEWDISINYGIKTGYNEAFIITTEQKEQILSSCQSEEEKEKTNLLIRKMLRGRDIKRYSYEWADLWLINTHNGYTTKDKEKIPPIDIEEYPALKAHLDQYYTALEKRADKGVTPYNLRHCGYLEEFEKEKIVYSEIVQKAQFYFDKLNYFAEATSFIMTGENLKYLIGCLNSPCVTYFFKAFYAGAGLGEKGYRYKKAFLENLPIPKIDSKNQKIADQIIALVEEILSLKEQNPKANTSTLESQIDSLVYTLYNLTEEEIAIIKEKIQC